MKQAEQLALGMGVAAFSLWLFGTAINYGIHKGEVAVGDLKPGQCFNYIRDSLVVKQGKHTTLFKEKGSDRFETLPKDRYVKEIDCFGEFEHERN